MRFFLPSSALRICIIAASTSLGHGQTNDRLRIDLRDVSTDSRSAAGWSVWAERPEIKPKCFVDTVNFRSVPGALAISGNGNPAEYGGWTYTVAGIKAGKFYKLTAFYRTQAVPDQQRRVVARLDW